MLIVALHPFEYSATCLDLGIGAAPIKLFLIRDVIFGKLQAFIEFFSQYTGYLASVIAYGIFECFYFFGVRTVSFLIWKD